jgi:N-acyl-D-amino-acid deacylase
MRTMLVGGMIHEGTGAPPVKGDLLIEGDRIADVFRGPSRELPVDIKIDCTNLDILPGFINIHSHFDFSLAVPENRSATALISQGITTEAVGQCGQSVLPLPRSDPGAAMVRDYLEYFLRPLNLRANWEWNDFKDFARMIEEDPGININVVLFVGHTNLRLAAMGYSARSATHEEVAAMAKLLTENLEQGAFGLSSGLQWAPAFFADNDELVQLARVLHRHHGIYTTHMRAEGDMLLEALEETIDLARRVEIPVQVSHLKAAGRKNWGKTSIAIEMIDAERRRGIDIAPDKQPYVVENMGLRAILPPWVIVEAGGVDGLAEKLKHASGRAETKRAVTDKTAAHWSSCVVDSIWEETGFDDLIIDGCPLHPTWEGRSVSQIAVEEQVDPWDLIFDLLSEGKSAPTALYAFESESDLRTLYEYPFTVCASDYFGKRHPRNWGTFPRFLGRLAHREHWLEFEEAVRRVTSLAATRLGIHDRGTIARGNFADIVVIDRDALVDMGTYDSPETRPSGIVHVLVNGKQVIAHGVPVTNGGRPGRVLRRS